MNMNEIVESLRKYIGDDKVIKIKDSKYKIKTDLSFVSSFDEINVDLVEYDGVVYFADYGATFNEISQQLDKSFLDFSNETQKELYKKFEILSIEFDGRTLLKETTKSSVYADYNTFVMMIMYLQAKFLI